LLARWLRGCLTQIRTWLTRVIAPAPKATAPATAPRVERALRPKPVSASAAVAVKPVAKPEPKPERTPPAAVATSPVEAAVDPAVEPISAPEPDLTLALEAETSLPDATIESAVEAATVPEPELAPASVVAPATSIEPAAVVEPVVAAPEPEPAALSTLQPEPAPIVELAASPTLDREPEAESELSPARKSNEPTRWSYCEACGHAFVVAPMSATRAGRPLRNRRRANRGCEQRRVPRPQPSRPQQPSA
jgi:hypothetical protein